MADILCFGHPMNTVEMNRRKLTFYKMEAPVVHGIVDMNEAIYFYKHVSPSQ